MLAEFIFLVKNLRGVLAAREGEELDDLVRWLRTRFRYRNLGLPEHLAQARPEVFSRYLGGKPFYVLRYPTQRVAQAAARAVRILSEVGVPEGLAHSALLASSYACPVIATPEALEAYRKSGLVIHEVKGPHLDSKSARLHLRIADYSVLDVYVKLLSEASRAVETGNAGDILASRRAFAQRDAKRYWRLSSQGDHTVIAYIDYAHLLAEQAADLLLDGETRVLGALLVAFNIGCILGD